MRRFVAFLLLTPLLASCSDSVTPVTPVAPSDAVARHDESLVVASPLEAGWTESPFDNWTLDDWTLGASTLEAATLGEATVQSAPSSGAVMTFGNPIAGSSFPSGVHDASFHGRDRVIPGTVVVNAGQAVTFHVFPGHRVAIYKPGKRPEDIVVDPNNFFVLDPTLRQAIQAAPVPVLSFTFHNPGTYLVICAITRHFVQSNMYGWVHVR